MANKEAHIELHSEEVQELLGTPPSRMVRWGTSLVILAILVLFSVGWWVKYPEVVKAPVQLTTETPPVPVVSPSNGYIEQWFVQEEDEVLRGSPIGLLNNPARYEDVVHLEENLALIQPYRTETFSSFDLSYPYVLGSLQEAYSRFATILRRHQINGKGEDERGREIPGLKKRIQQLQKSLAQDEKKKNDAELTFQTRTKAYKGIQKKYAQNEISLLELQDYRAELSQAEYRIKNLGSEIEEKQRTINFLKEQINQLQEGNDFPADENLEEVSEAQKNLYAQLEIWKGKFLLTAPIAGMVSTFKKELRKNQFVAAGETVLIITPKEDDHILAIAELPVREAAKVREGQISWITLAGYPIQEYGKIRGKVSYKAGIPNGQTVSAEISLPEGLSTTAKKDLPFAHQMVGTAEIITDQKRLFERILESFQF